MHGGAWRPDPNEIRTSLEILSAMKDSRSSDVEVLKVGSEPDAIWIVYRHERITGTLGFRQNVHLPESEYESATDIANQVWYAEIEPVPDLMHVERIGGVQWWGDRPFPNLAMSVTTLQVVHDKTFVHANF